MYGHVHKEHFDIQRSFETDKQINIGYWTGAVSSFSDNNPSFRVFELDVETMVAVKVHTYIFNLTQENPEWHWDHEFSELYEMKDLSPSSFDELSSTFLQDEAACIKFLNTKTQNVFLHNSCDESCRKDLYCQTRNGIYFDYK